MSKRWRVLLDTSRLVLVVRRVTSSTVLHTPITSITEAVRHTLKITRTFVLIVWSPLKRLQAVSWLFLSTHDSRLSFSQQQWCRPSAPYGIPVISVNKTTFISLLKRRKSTGNYTSAEVLGAWGMFSAFLPHIMSVHSINNVKVSPSWRLNFSTKEKKTQTAIESEIKLMLDGSFCSNKNNKGRE